MIPINNSDDQDIENLFDTTSSSGEEPIWLRIVMPIVIFGAGIAVLIAILFGD